MTNDSPSLITIYEPLILCIKGKFFSRTTYHVHIVHQWNQKDINTDIFSLWIQTDRYRCFGNGEYHKHSLKEQKSGLNCKRRSYVKPSWQNVNYNLQDNDDDDDDDDDDDKTMVIITILIIIIINRKLKQRRRQRQGKRNWLKVAWTYLFVRWLCFWIGFFGRNDLTDFYDFWHP